MLSSTESDERIRRGLDFINANGSDHTKAIGNAIVNPDNVDEALNALRPFQNADGGWRGLDSDMKGPLSTISCTWVALQWLSWLNGKNSESLKKTVEFIVKAQYENGSWDEPDEILKYDPPPWMIPREYENQLWLTSAICCQLMEINKTAEINFNLAIDFLRAGWDGKRFPGATHPHWMAIVIFYNLREDSAINEAIAEGCKQFLTQQILEDKEDPFDFVDIAYASLRVGSWADDLLKLSTDRMLESQAEDGGWITNYGDSHRPMGTAKAIYLLKIL